MVIMLKLLYQSFRSPSSSGLRILWRTSQRKILDVSTKTLKPFHATGTHAVQTNVNNRMLSARCYLARIPTVAVSVVSVIQQHKMQRRRITRGMKCRVKTKDVPPVVVIAPDPRNPTAVRGASSSDTKVIVGDCDAQLALDP